MADPAVWQALINTGNPYWHEEQRQKGLAGMLQLEKMQRGLEQEKNLQELFARSANPSVGAVGAISPQFATEYGKSRIEQQRMQQQLDAADYEMNASIFGPISERALIAKQSGDPQWQEKFNRDMGIAASGIIQSGGRLPNNFNPETTDPWTVLTNSVGFKYKSPYLENMMALERTRGEEATKLPYDIQRKQTPSASDRYFIGPDGLPHLNPLFQGNGQQPPVQSQIQPYPVFQFDGKKYSGPEFMRMAIREKDPAKKQRMEAIMDAGFQQQQEGTLTSPDVVEKPKTRQELEVEVAGAKKKAELDVQAEHEAEQQLTTMKALDAQNVEALIDKSFHSKPEAIAKGEYGLSGMAGMPTEANTAYKDLVVIEAQMRDMAKAIVGAGPISEGEQKIIKDALGGVSTPGDAASRKSAYRKFVEMAKAKIAKYPHLAQQMKAIEQTAGKEGSAATPTTKSLKIGDIDEGMEYLGGDPHSESSWRKVK